MEWLLFVPLCALAVILVWPGVRRSRKWLWAVAFGVTALTVTAAVVWDIRRQKTASDREAFFSKLPREGRPGGYVKSASCQACHPSQYESWRRSYHRTMTQYVTPEAVMGEFDNVDLEAGDQVCHLERRGDEFWVEMDDPEWRYERPTDGSLTTARPPRVTRRLGMMTGSHHMQVYWVPGRVGNLQFIFPFTYLKDDHRWVPRHDVFLRSPDLPDPPQNWNVNCIKCHTTVGQPRPANDARIHDTRTGELGIACEVCHGPGEEHVRVQRDPLHRYVAHAKAPIDSTVFNPARRPSKVAAEICGQCHSTKWTLDYDEWLRTGQTYRPGEELERTAPIVRPTQFATETWLPEAYRRDQKTLSRTYWSDGMVRVSGREYNGLLESPCYQKGELTCLSCHSIHQGKPVNQLGSEMESNQACLQCHATMRDRVAEHTHHPAGSSGSLCYNCHMPYTTYGLLKGIRSHQITSPDAQTTLQTGRPDACSLCHLDRPLEWTARQLTRWYGKPAPELPPEHHEVSAALLWLLRGDAGQRALIANSMGWAPAVEASGAGWQAPFLAGLLEDPYSAVRYIAARSLKRLPGYDRLAYDYVGPPEQMERAAKEALAIWAKAKPTSHAGPEVLMDASGVLRRPQIDHWRSQRDNHSIVLNE